MKIILANFTKFSSILSILISFLSRFFYTNKLLYLIFFIVARLYWVKYAAFRYNLGYCASNGIEINIDKQKAANIVIPLDILTPSADFLYSFWWFLSTPFPSLYRWLRLNIAVKCPLFAAFSYQCAVILKFYYFLSFVS